MPFGNEDMLTSEPPLEDVGHPAVSGEFSSLTRRAVHGVFWNAMGAALRQIVLLATGIVLARWLSPGDFKIVGLATSVLLVFAAMAGQGFAAALVRERELESLKCHSIFWLMIAVGTILTGFMMAVAPWVAGYYEQPALANLLPILGLSLIFNLAASVPDAIAVRNMQFRKKNVVIVLGSLVSASVAMGVALSGGAYWAPILANVGSSIALGIGAFWVSGYRPAFRFSWRELLSVASFGLSMLGTAVFNCLSDVCDYFIMGRYWRKTDNLGFYAFANERAKHPFAIVSTQISMVAFSAFSKVQDDVNRMRDAYLRGTRWLAAVTLPGYVLLIGLADPLVPWIFGAKWLPAVPAFQVFAAFAFVRTFSDLVSAPLLAMDYAQAGFLFTLFRIVVTVPALFCLGWFGAGILGVAIGMVVIWTVQAPFFIGFTYRKMKLGWSDFWNAFGRLLAAALAMGAILAAIRGVASATQLADWAMVPIAMLLSAGAFLVIARSIVWELVALARQVLVTR